MEEEKTPEMQNGGNNTPVEATPAPRPNRDAYAQMFAEDNPGIDFEDKEARYGRMNEERKRYRSYRDSGKKLAAVFDKNPWTAQMMMDLKDNDDLDPIQWMADNGIDIAEAMEDEAYRKNISDRIAKYQKGQIEGKEAAKQREENLYKSSEALQSLQKEFGLDDEQRMQVWTDFFTNVMDPALNGEISADTWKMIIKARNYDNDIANAREEGAMKARNEKIQNKLKSPTEGEVPPTLSQGGSTKAGQPQTKKRSGFFDDLGL